MARGATDPATKAATAFYTVLGVTLADVVRHGFHKWSVAMSLALAGVATLDGIAYLVHGKKRP